MQIEPVEGWTQDIPTKAGAFWFFGDVSCQPDHHWYKEELHLVMVYEGQDAIFVTGGQFMFPESSHGLWKLCVLPDHPTITNKVE